MDNLFTSKQARLSYLDVYKGICIIFILITHFSWTDTQRKTLLFPFWIEMAVPIFLVITGYLSALSFDKKNVSFKKAYSPRSIISKWARFIIPALPILIIQFFILFFVQNNRSFIEIFKWYLSYGGPGAYYIYFMLQVVLIVPIEWSLVRKNEIWGIVICFFVNVAYEIVKTIINMPDSIYRLCVLRNLFILAFGCFIYKTEQTDNKEIISKPIYLCVGLTGIAYIIVYNYTSLKPIFTSQWTTTSVFAVLYIVPVMMILMKKKDTHCKIFEMLGQASYEIFLTQVLYYWFFAEKIYNLIPSLSLQLIISISICCIVGYMFYQIESPITQRIVKKIRG